MMLQTAENGRIGSAENGRFCRRRQTETASKLPRAFLQNCLETTASVFGKMTTPTNRFHSFSQKNEVVYPKKWGSLHKKLRQFQQKSEAVSRLHTGNFTETTSRRAGESDGQSAEFSYLICLFLQNELSKTADMICRNRQQHNLPNL